VYEDHITRVNLMVFNFTETYISVLNMTRFPLGNDPVLVPFLVSEKGLAATVYTFNKNVT